MSQLTIPALPLFLQCLIEQLPVGAASAFRAMVADSQGNDSLLTAARRHFVSLGLTPDDGTDTERRNFLLRPVAGIVAPFQVYRPSDPLPTAWRAGRYTIALEAMAVYTSHLVRDLFSRFGQMGGSSHLSSGDGTTLNDTVRSAVDIAERIGMVYQLTHVEALEAVLDAAWAERASDAYLAVRTVPVLTGEGICWSVDQDCFVAGPRGLTWYRNGVTWLGNSYICGARPEVRYRDDAAMRLNVASITSTKPKWLATPTVTQLSPRRVP